VSIAPGGMMFATLAADARGAMAEAAAAQSSWRRFCV